MKLLCGLAEWQGTLFEVKPIINTEDTSLWRDMIAYTAQQGTWCRSYTKENSNITIDAKHIWHFSYDKPLSGTTQTCVPTHTYSHTCPHDTDVIKELFSFCVFRSHKETLSCVLCISRKCMCIPESHMLPMFCCGSVFSVWNVVMAANLFKISNCRGMLLRATCRHNLPF